MFKTAFNKLHEHSHTGMKITYNTFKQYYYIPFLEKWLSIFIHDCIECQRNKHFNIKIQTAPTQSFSEHAPSFNYRISMDTTLMGIRHSPRTAYSPWTNGLVEVQNRNLGTHLRMFLHETPKDWAFQVHMYAYAHNSQPLSELNISPHEIVFHNRPRIPLTFDLNLNRDTSKTCISRYCSQLPEHSHYDKSDLNPFFYKTLSKPIPHWFLAVETAMLQIYSTVYENTLRKINSHAYITKTYHEGKPLPIGIFVLKRNFTHVHFSDKLKPLRIGPYKIIDRLSDVTYELLAQDGSTVHVHRNHLNPYYPKEPLLCPHLRSFMRFSDTTQFQIPQPTKYANSDSSPFNSDESLSEEDSQTSMTSSTMNNSSQTFVTPSSFSTSNQNTPSITSNDKSLTPSTNDNSLYRHIINTPHTNVSSDRSRHSSNNQTTSLPPLIDRTTKTTYKLQQQPKLDYRLFITPSKL